MPKFQVKDDVRWSLQEREFEKTDSGKQMLGYIEKLLCGAEAEMKKLRDIPVEEAFGRSMVQVEEEFGNASLHALGRIIIITCWHWRHGDALFDGFTLLEKKLFSAAAMAHIEETQEAAKPASFGDE